MRAFTRVRVRCWERGRQLGLKQYCTQDNAYQIGKRGYALNAVCPAETVATLQQINAAGRAYHMAENQLKQTREKLTKHQEEYRQLRDGNNLDFKSEKEARNYLLRLPELIRTEELRMVELQQQLQSLQRKYGY